MERKKVNMTKKEMIEIIEELRRWVKCGFTKSELQKMSKDEVQDIFLIKFREFSK